MALFHVSSDTNCVVLHYGKQMQTINKGDCVEIVFVKGRHKLIFMSAQYGPAVSEDIELIVPDNQYEDYIDIKLSEREERFTVEVKSHNIYSGAIVEDENHCKYSPDYRLLVEVPRDLKQLTVDKRCEVIRSDSFYGCSALETVILPSSVIAIGDRAFCRCKKLERVNMPKNLVYLGEFAFSDCSSLQALYLPDSLYYFPPVRGFSYERSIWDEDSEITYTQRKPWNIIIGCRSLKELSLPTSVHEIGEDAFMGLASLKQVDISPDLKAIGKCAFGSTGLESIELPESIGIIPETAFAYSGLKSISLPDSIVKIGRKAFVACPFLQEVKLSPRLAIIDSDAFNCCDSLAEITLPPTVSFIGDCVFVGCKNLKKVIIKSENPPEIGNSVFDDSDDLFIYVPSGSLELYRTTPEWANYANRIIPI